MRKLKRHYRLPHKRSRAKRFKIKGLYLDLEFFTVDVINYLPKGKYLLPCLRFKRKMRRYERPVCGEEKLPYHVYNALYGW